MAIRSYNMDEIKDGFTILEPGKQVFRILDVESKVENNKDIDVLQVECLTMEGNPVAELKVYYTEKALWVVKSLLKALGVETKGQLQFDLASFIGEIFVATVKHEPYKKANTQTGEIEEKMGQKIEKFEIYNEADWA